MRELVRPSSSLTMFNQSNVSCQKSKPGRRLGYGSGTSFSCSTVPVQETLEESNSMESLPSDKHLFTHKISLQVLLKGIVNIFSSAYFSLIGTFIIQV